MPDADDIGPIFEEFARAFHDRVQYCRRDSVNQRVSVITLACGRIPVSVRFYKKLGWKPGHHDADVAFFQLQGAVLALYGRKSFAKDYRLPLSRVKSGGVALAQNQVSKREVDQVMARAKKAGARLLTRARDTYWGGYAGSFADPDGHAWEIAWNPHWKLDAKGNVRMT